MTQTPHGPTWYEILGVDRAASPDEIKAAWRNATDKFEPGSGQGQFRLFNEAADVLLDPERRREYDARLAGTPATPRPEAEPEDDQPAPAQPDVRQPEPERQEREQTPVPSSSTDKTSADATRGGVLQLVLLALVALALVASAVFGVLIAKRSGDAGIGFVEGVVKGDSEARQEAGVSAAAAAERALVAALSYDYRRMEADKQRALSFMSPRYGKQFGETFDKLLTAAKEGEPNNVVRTRTVVKASVLQVGVMNPAASSTTRVRVLAYVNQTATKGTASPTIFQNRVAVTMVRRDGKWLIDGLTSY